MDRLTVGKADYAALARMAGRLDFFKPFNGREVELLLSHFQLKSFRKGETIFLKGQPTEALYVVYEGRVRILLNRHWFWLIRRHARLEPGELFGEKSLLGKRPHSTTALAAKPTKLFVLLRDDFDMLVQRNPRFAEGIRRAASRRNF